MKHASKNFAQITCSNILKHLSCDRAKELLKTCEAKVKGKYINVKNVEL